MYSHELNSWQSGNRQAVTRGKGLSVIKGGIENANWVPRQGPRGRDRYTWLKGEEWQRQQ